MAANNSTALSKLQPKNNADGSDQVVAFSTVSSNSDVLIPVSNLYTNTTLIANNLVIMQNNTPANSSANAVPKTIWSDGNYIYVAISNNSIKRVALTTF